MSKAAGEVATRAASIWIVACMNRRSLSRPSVGLLVCLVLIFENDCFREIDAVVSRDCEEQGLIIGLTRIRTESTKLIEGCSRHIAASNVIKQCRKSNYCSQVC